MQLEKEASPIFAQENQINLAIYKTYVEFTKEQYELGTAHYGEYLESLRDNYSTC